MDGIMVQEAGHQRLPTAERRAEILAAALSLFGRKAYDSVGMRDVAAECGLSAAAIYRHFPNKESLLVGLFDRLSDTMNPVIRAASRFDDPRERLDYLVGQHVAMVLAEPMMIPVYQHEAASLPVEERQRFRAVESRYEECWRQTLRGLRSDSTEASVDVTIHGVFGLMNSFATYAAERSPRTLEKAITDLAWKVLGRRPSGVTKRD